MLNFMVLEINHVPKRYKNTYLASKNNIDLFDDNFSEVVCLKNITKTRVDVYLLCLVHG